MSPAIFGEQVANFGIDGERMRIVTRLGYLIERDQFRFGEIFSRRPYDMESHRLLILLTIVQRNAGNPWLWTRYFIVANNSLLWQYRKMRQLIFVAQSACRDQDGGAAFKDMFHGACGPGPKMGKLKCRMRLLKPLNASL